MTALLIQVGVLGGFGVLFFLIGTRASVRQAAFNRRAITTTGRAVSWEARRSRMSSGSYTTRHFPMVEYQTQQGQVLRRLGLGIMQPGQVGQPIEVTYDPQNPADVSFMGRRGQLGLPKILIVSGVVMVAVAGGLMLRQLL